MKSFAVSIILAVLMALAIVVNSIYINNVGERTENAILSLPDPSDPACISAAAGLERYEISTFARRGYESRHNLKYWNTEEYLGFGPGAHSDFGGVRFGNGRDIEGYVRGADICEERYEPDAAERVREAVMLGMRLREGISQKRLQERFGALAEPFARAFTPYVAGGFVKQTEEGYAVTTKGMLVSNSILSDILDFG